MVHDAMKILIFPEQANHTQGHEALKIVHRHTARQTNLKQSEKP